MIEIVDLNNCELSYKNGLYGGLAGAKDGILYNGEEWMVKYPKNLTQMEGENDKYSTAPLSEYLGSHIYQILGYNVHETILGERNGKIVVACKDFETEGKRLVEIRTLKNHTGKELFDFLETYSSSSSSDSQRVDIDELMIHLERNPVLIKIDGIINHFFEQALIDIFINNNDRNNGNWGIIRERGQKDIIAPIYDNGASFFSKAPENKIIKILNNEQLINNAVNNVMTAYYKGDHSFTGKKFIINFIENPKFQQAVKKVVPLIKEKMPEIKEMMNNIPSSYISKDGTNYTVFSNIRKEYYQSNLDIKMKYLLEPTYNKVKELELLSKKEINCQNINSYNDVCNMPKVSQKNKYKMDREEFDR